MYIGDMTSDHVVGLVKELLNYPGEAEWFEFKENFWDPVKIGQYTSALSNGAALHQKPFGYLVWGINDASKHIVGTNVSPTTEKKGGEPFENWLARMITPSRDTLFAEAQVNGARVVVMQVERAISNPTTFQNEAYIRIGESLKVLSAKECEAKQRKLWRALEESMFEDGIAADQQTVSQVLSKLNYKAVFEMLNLSLPRQREQILDRLLQEKFVVRSDYGGYGITNLGAIVCAHDISEFSTISRKCPRVIRYDGLDKSGSIVQRTFTGGYATEFATLIRYINEQAPGVEVIDQALRRNDSDFPEIAIRELVANALIHMDFTIKGAGPVVEIYDDRMEITNPGEPIIDVDRFLDNPPRSRNEDLAAFMRRVRICEELGSGVDKAIISIETNHLPAPLFEAPGDNTRVTIYGPRPLDSMTKEERIRICYYHAGIRYLSKHYLTNSSLRERFKLSGSDAPKISRYIREALDDRTIKPLDDQAGKRAMKYVPYWA